MAAASSKQFVVINLYKLSIISLLFCEISVIVIANSLADTNDAALHELVERNDYVMALFYTANCPKCESAVKTVEALPQELFQRVNCQKIKSASLSRQYGITDYPSILYFRKTMPVIYETALAWTVEELTQWLEETTDILTQTLTDSSFEHLTQAGSGATTGDWLVLFYHDECRSALPVLETVAHAFKQSKNMAKLNLDENPLQGKRFRIKKCPQIIFFRLGRLYRYEPEQYDWKSIYRFVDSWHKNVKAEMIPVDITKFDQLTENIAEALRSQLEGPNRAVFLGITVMFSLLIIIAVVSCLRSKSRQETTTTRKDD